MRITDALGDSWIFGPESGCLALLCNSESECAFLSRRLGEVVRERGGLSLDVGRDGLTRDLSYEIFASLVEFVGGSASDVALLGKVVAVLLASVPARAFGVGVRDAVAVLKVADSEYARVQGDIQLARRRLARLLASRAQPRSFRFFRRSGALGGPLWIGFEGLEVLSREALLGVLFAIAFVKSVGGRGVLVRFALPIGVLSELGVQVRAVADNWVHVAGPPGDALVQALIVSADDYWDELDETERAQFASMARRLARQCSLSVRAWRRILRHWIGTRAGIDLAEDRRLAPYLLAFKYLEPETFARILREPGFEVQCETGRTIVAATVGEARAHGVVSADQSASESWKEVVVRLEGLEAFW